MVTNIKQQNRGPARQRAHSRGFTLIETMVAIFILTISLTAFFGVVANSLFAARYANNEITATYLLQEAADSIRNDRDSMQESSPGSGGWTQFQTTYSACFTNDGCEVEPESNTISACSTPASSNFGGSINCKLFNYDGSAANKDFYTYQAVVSGNGPTNINQCKSNPGWQSYINPTFKNQGACIGYVHDHINVGGQVNFKRKVKMILNASNGDEIDVKVTVEWLNGNLIRSQSLTTSLLNWRKNF